MGQKELEKYLMETMEEKYEIVIETQGLYYNIFKKDAIDIKHGSIYFNRETEQIEIYKKDTFKPEIIGHQELLFREHMDPNYGDNYYLTPTITNLELKIIKYLTIYKEGRRRLSDYLKG